MYDAYVINLPHQETYFGFDIFIESNPDQYLEGFFWSINKDDEEHDCGLDFDVKQALEAAFKAIEKQASL